MKLFFFPFLKRRRQNSIEFMILYSFNLCKVTDEFLWQFHRFQRRKQKLRFHRILSENTTELKHETCVPLFFFFPFVFFPPIWWGCTVAVVLFFIYILLFFIIIMGSLVEALTIIQGDETNHLGKKLRIMGT